jgi:hypothetical protein
MSALASPNNADPERQNILGVIAYAGGYVPERVTQAHYDAAQLIMARGIAFTTHGRQQDAGGQPYMGHIAAVVNTVAPLKCVPVTVAAYLHDVLEYSANAPWLQNQLYKNFTRAVAEGVRVLTRHRGEPYGEYIERVAEGGLIPVTVKLAELEDNMDLSRLGGREQTDAEYRQQEDYKQARARLWPLFNEMHFLRRQDAV